MSPFLFATDLRELDHQEKLVGPELLFLVDPLNLGEGQSVEPVHLRNLARVVFLGELGQPLEVLG